MAGFPIHLAPGTLVLPSGYTFPNPSVVVHDFGFSELWLPTLTGTNSESSTGHLARARTLKQQVGSFPIVIDGSADTEGNVRPDANVGYWDVVQELSDELLAPTIDQGTDGCQTCTFTPREGRDPIDARFQFEAIDLQDRHSGWGYALVRVTLPDGPIRIPGS